MIISIIIPTYNRCEILKETLESFLSLKHNENNFSYEIIVVDNNSHDSTKNVVMNFNGKLPITYLHEPKQGKNNALNLAIRQAHGDVLVFADDDVFPDKNWLSEIYLSSQRYPDGLVFGGKILPLFPKFTPEWMQNSYYSPFVYAIHDPVQDEGFYHGSGTPGGANCWVRRSIFTAGHMYDNDIGPKGYGRISGSELEFFTRLLKQGVRPIYIPMAVVKHRIQHFQTTKKYLLKRSFASGRGIAYINNDTKSVRLFGVPRYLFRDIIESSMKALWFLVKFDIKTSFEQLMTVAHRVGCIKQYRVINQGN